MRWILYILFAVGGVLVAIALSMVILDDETQQIEPQSQSIDLSKPAPVGAQPAPLAAEPTQTDPSIAPQANLRTVAATLPPLIIDLARVKPDGAAVFAGTAAPNAKISIFEGDILLGETIANGSGEWVIVLEKMLAPGQHLISVAMERPDGSTELADRSLAVEIYQDAESKPLVALLPETATDVPVLIQSPDDVEPAQPANTTATVTVTPSPAKPQPASTTAKVTVTPSPAKPQPASTTAKVTVTPSPAKPQPDIATTQLAALTPTAIVWRDAGSILISGTSRGGIKVTATDPKRSFGEALVLVDGDWQIAGSFDMSLTVNHLRFELYDEANRVIAHYDLPISARDLAKGQDGSPLIVVNKGDALWRIAYHQLGEGVKYVDIVRRNRQDISDPNLIYPKQIFAVPNATSPIAGQN
ncbi:MAG: LysM peptidoglycan-binding domain-containing protein [Candidatus Puniceispirillum sp.]|nr:LysM peptidoglycan-binding domain-containing protein [Candidatus Puniceispirillum sp.]